METIIESLTNDGQEIITVLYENGYQEKYEVDMRFTVNGKDYISYCPLSDETRYTSRIEEVNGVSSLHTIDDEEWDTVEATYNQIWDERAAAQGEE